MDSPNIDKELVRAGFRIRNDDLAQTTLARLAGSVDLGHGAELVAIQSEVTLGRDRHSKRVTLAFMKDGQIRSALTFFRQHLPELIAMLGALEDELRQ